MGPVPFSPLFSGMQYDPPPPTPTEKSSIFSGMQYDPPPPTRKPPVRQYNRQVLTPTLHVPQTMQYEQALGTAVGRYRLKIETSPRGLTRQNDNFITNMVNSEGPLPRNSSLALANTVSYLPSPHVFFCHRFSHAPPSNPNISSLCLKTSGNVY